MGLFQGERLRKPLWGHGQRPHRLLGFLVDERVRMFAFRDIEDSADEMAVGWVSATDFMDTAFQYASYALDPYVVMGLRIDRRKLPAGVLQKYFRMAVAKAKAPTRGRGHQPGRAGDAQGKGQAGFADPHSAGHPGL